MRKACSTVSCAMSGVIVSDAARLDDAAQDAHRSGFDGAGRRRGDRDPGGEDPAAQIAARLVAFDRYAEYGDARDTHERVSAMWNALIPQGSRIDAFDCLLMMAALKLVRAKKNPDHRDSVVDAIGYLQLADNLRRNP